MKSTGNNIIHEEKKHYINGTKGVISLFLALLMIPFIVQADALIELARYHAVVSALDEIMDSAATSVLSNYDPYLMDRFGLAAIDQRYDIANTYASYFNSNMGSSSGGVGTAGGQTVTPIAWNNSAIAATGMYALNDPAVLENQIMEFSKYSVITEMTSDVMVTNVERILQKMNSLKSFNAITKAVGGVADAAGSLADAVSSFEDLEDAIDEIEKDLTTYNEKYDAFETKTDELVAALKDVEKKQQAKDVADEALSQANTNAETAKGKVEEINQRIEDLEDQKRDGIITDEEYNDQMKTLGDLLDQYSDEKNSADSGQKSAKEEAETASDELEKAKGTVEAKKKQTDTAASEYAVAIEDLIKSLEDGKKKTESAMTSLTSVASSLDSATKGIMDASSTVKSVNMTNQNKELDEENRALKQQMYDFSDAGDGEVIQKNIDANQAIIDANQNLIDAEKGTQTTLSNISTGLDAGIKCMEEVLKEGLKTYHEEKYGQCISNLRSLDKIISNFSADNVTSSFKCDKSTYYVTVSGYPQKSDIANALVNAENMFDDDEKTGFWALLKGFSKAMDGLFKINVFYDSNLDAVISSDLLGTESNGLDAVINSLCDLAEDMHEVSSHNFKKKKLSQKLKTLVKAYKDAEKAVGAIGSYATSMLTSVANSINQLANGAYDKVLISQYLNLSLANRLTYAGKDVLTGYPFSGAGLSSVQNKTDSVFVVGAFSALANAVKQHNGGSSDMFCGAETEYVLTGSRSEIANQTMVFMNIYFVRLVIDGIFMLGNTEVQGIIDAAGAASAGIGALLVYIFYLVLEPFIDTIVIVNGAKIDVFKKCYYLTPTGLPTLLGRLTNLKLTDDQKEEVSANLAAALKQNYLYGTAASKDAGIFTAGYSDYLFLFLLFQDNAVSLRRFQNLISLEGKKHYGSFDIGQAYTFVSAQASGDYQPFLSAATVYTNFAFSKSRSQVRGY